ncbi:MAG: hypothetical protein CTY33_00240 [Methylotenera sp.]|nr:MAG: hypothetical protein CTY33_00240 [Methylotenera sp.]
MIEEDKKEFAALLKSSMAIYQQEASTDVLRIWWAALERFDISQVRDAFGRHIQDTKTGKFAPRPADILAILEMMNPDGRLGVEEAWAMFPHDEASSAVITDEMAEAMQSARPLMLEGDTIAARMAFKEAYTRITNKNKFNGVAPRWFPSLGHSKEGREIAIKHAVELGRLSSDFAQSLLPAPENQVLDKNLLKLQNLMKETPITPEQKQQHKERMANIKSMLTSK